MSALQLDSNVRAGAATASPAPIEQVPNHPTAVPAEGGTPQILGTAAPQLGDGMRSPGQDSGVPKESFGQVLKAAHDAPKVSVGETRQSTIDFINNQPFFHQGLMNMPIGGGKHFRNVPFAGPGEMLGGLLTANGTNIRKGWETTKGTLAAP